MKQAASSAQDCNSNPPNPGGEFCCLEFEDGGPEPDSSVNDGGVSDSSVPGNDGATGADAPSSCPIEATSYDQSCSADIDCVEVTSTDYCSSSCLCGGSAINLGALPKFNADISKTPLGSGSTFVACPCVAPFGPCCRSGQCTDRCFSPADTLPVCADAGGTCILGAHATCGRSGPPDGCAFPDQICCLN